MHCRLLHGIPGPSPTYKLGQYKMFPDITEGPPGSKSPPPPQVSASAFFWRACLAQRLTS